MRIAYIDTRKLTWCSANSVVFHSFTWSRDTKQTRGTARTLFTNHCDWTDVLIVRDPYFNSSKIWFTTNKILDNLLWNWSSAGRSCVVCKEGTKITDDGVHIPDWLEQCYIYKVFYQYHLIGNHNWHHPDALRSNTTSRRHLFFNHNCDYFRVEVSYPTGCNTDITNTKPAAQLARIVIQILDDIPPSLSTSNIPLASVLRSRKFEPPIKNK